MYLLWPTVKELVLRSAQALYFAIFVLERGGRFAQVSLVFFIFKQSVLQTTYIRSCLSFIWVAHFDRYNIQFNCQRVKGQLVYLLVQGKV